MLYDVIFIGGGASSLFSGAFSDKKIKALILEKTDRIGTKLLLSGGGRANLTNIDIDEERDYFGRNKKALKSIFSKFNNWDLISFLEENSIKLNQEDRGRMLLESGNSKEVLNFLVNKNKQNNVEIKLNKQIKKIEKKDDIFILETVDSEIFQSKNVVVSSGGKSFGNLGTTGDGYNFADGFGIKTSNFYRGLCGIVTKEMLEDISGSSVVLGLELKYKDKIIYSEEGPLLFAHFGLSGPIIFNSVLALGEFIDKNNFSEIEDYSEFSINLTFDLEKTPKKIIKFFDLSGEKSIINLKIENLRSWKESKVTGGGILLDELDNNLQSKKVKNLFFIGEILDITGKTGGYNLQFVFSTGYIVIQYIKKML